MFQQFRLLTIIFILFFSVSIDANQHEKNVLIVLTSHDTLGNTGQKTGFWLPELTHPYYALTKMGIHVDVASIQGGLAPIDAKALKEDDPYNQVFLNDPKLLNKVLNTLSLEEVNRKDYDAILFSGGSGPMWDFANNADVANLVTTQLNQNKVVAAVCHGVAALVGVKDEAGQFIVAGKRIAAFSNEEENQLGTQDIVPFLLESKLIEQGARYVPGKAWQGNIVVDGNLITGQNPASATQLAHEIAKKLL